MLHKSIFISSALGKTNNKNARTAKITGYTVINWNDITGYLREGFFNKFLAITVWNWLLNLTSARYFLERTSTGF